MFFVSMATIVLTFLTQGLFCWGKASCAPSYPTHDPDAMSKISTRATSLALIHLGNAASTGFLWSSIGLAILTAFLQGLVTSLAFMTESSNSWTFRFRLAKIEHWWWTLVSCLLFASLCFNVLSFVSGNSNEAVTILVLSTTTLLAIVRYMLPAWNSRKYLQNRFLAWTGPSRTGVDSNLKVFCGGRDDWGSLAKQAKSRGTRGVASDNYGWHLWRVDGIRLDPADIINSGVVNPLTVAMRTDIRYIYDDGYNEHGSVSLYWGVHSGFLPRVSRSISSVPVNLLKSQPFTNDGFSGEGLCLAMGILGRNKGLKPSNLIFSMNRELSTHLENNSTWYPRPAKTLRSYYRKVLGDVYGGLGESFVFAAIELSLILMDASPTAIASWLATGCEHQSIQVNEDLKRNGATADELRAHYESSYVSMIVSINNMKDEKVGQYNHGKAQVARPDIMCLGLLLKARGNPMPAWWEKGKFRSYRQAEDAHLDFKWKDTAAKLLGFSSYPTGSVDRFWANNFESNKESLSGIAVSEDATPSPDSN